MLGLSCHIVVIYQERIRRGGGAHVGFFNIGPKAGPLPLSFARRPTLDPPPLKNPVSAPVYECIGGGEYRD